MAAKYLRTDFRDIVDRSQHRPFHFLLYDNPAHLHHDWNLHRVRFGSFFFTNKPIFSVTIRSAYPCLCHFQRLLLDHDRVHALDLHLNCLSITAHQSFPCTSYIGFDGYAYYPIPFSKRDISGFLSFSPRLRHLGHILVQLRAWSSGLLKQ